MRKDDLNRMRVASEPAMGEPEKGDALLAVRRFSLTTNNITYAAYGDPMGYWAFFPCSDPAWGRMPVWGFADVVASAADGLNVGERIYGFLPMADRLRVRPGRVRHGGFVDTMPHRGELPGGYNQYVRCQSDALYTPDTEALQAIYRPLYVTSFTLADYLRDNAFFGASRIILSSASSKTAYGTAFNLAGDGVEVVGLTSPGNAGFVGDTGFYDRVLDYAEVTDLPPDEPALYVDFSGNRPLRADIHQHFGDRLRFSSVVGSAQTTQLPRKMELPGPKPQFFFAPDQIAKRQKEWGAAVFAERFGKAWSTFLERASDPGRPLIRVVRGQGYAEAQQVIASLLSGSVPPMEGHVIDLD
ncbi:DUF2855 family protein [Ectothiorhodospiraceae bacterium WFHF3C12]|nr:DUF2855 family protein [Ectothiorhodospiraceae bacterium WFHF3C12]